MSDTLYLQTFMSRHCDHIGCHEGACEAIGVPYDDESKLDTYLELRLEALDARFRDAGWRKTLAGKDLCPAHGAHLDGAPADDGEIPVDAEAEALFRAYFPVPSLPDAQR